MQISLVARGFASICALLFLSAAVKDDSPRTYRFTVDYSTADTTGQVIRRNGSGATTRAACLEVIPSGRAFPRLTRVTHFYAEEKMTFAVSDGKAYGVDTASRSSSRSWTRKRLSASIAKRW